MTVADAIERAESVCSIRGGAERPVAWLSELEERIGRELFRAEETVRLTLLSELTAPNAYAELYPLYIIMKNAFVDGKIESYNNYARAFDRSYSEYIDYVNRSGEPKKTVYYKIL